jgi:hypothetical protein
MSSAWNDTSWLISWTFTCPHISIFTMTSRTNNFHPGLAFSYIRPDGVWSHSNQLQRSGAGIADACYSRFRPNTHQLSIGRLHLHFFVHARPCPITFARHFLRWLLSHWYIYTIASRFPPVPFQNLAIERVSICTHQLLDNAVYSRVPERIEQVRKGIEEWILIWSKVSQSESW